MLIPLLCDAVWRWAMEAASLLPDSPIRPDELPAAEWTVPAMPMIEPDKEGLAYLRLVRAGAMTPSQMVREQGEDPERHFDEYAADMKRFKALGIVLDVDASAVSQAGQAQVQASGDASKKPPADATAAETPPAESDSKN